MNLFLLVAVPASAVLIHRVWYRDFHWDRTLSSALYSLVLSLSALVGFMLLYPLTVFGGNLLFTALGQILVNALLAPGILVALHFIPLTAPQAPSGPRESGFALGLTLTLLFTYLGFTDFLTTDRQSDAWDLFGMPLTRVVQLAGLALASQKWLETPATGSRWVWGTLAALLILLQPLLSLLWYAGWGPAAFLIPVLLLAAGIWTQKKTASWRGGLSGNIAATTSEVPPEQP